MPFVLAADIKVAPNRQRRVFDPKLLKELEDDIRKTGLLHPVVLRSTGDHTLVAGERRLRAVQAIVATGTGIRHDNADVPEGYIPVTFLGDLPELAFREAELSENVQRVDLSWQERASAIRDLAELRKLQNPQVTTRDIAQEVFGDGEDKGWRSSEIQRTLKVAEHLDDPEIAKAGSMREAQKILDKKFKSQSRLLAALDFDSSKAPHQIFSGDCLEQLKKISDGAYSVILTDPPYGIGIDASVGWDGHTEHEYDDSPENLAALVSKLPEELYRVAADRAHLYWFCAIEKWHELRPDFLLAGWDVWPRPLIWYKGNVGAFPRPQHGPRYTYEAVLYALKGDKETNHLGHDVLSFPQEQRQNHPAGKPVALYTELLKRSARPGDTVLDPFAGGGTIFRAAKAASVTAHGIELNPKYHALCVEAIQESLK